MFAAILAVVMNPQSDTVLDAWNGLEAAGHASLAKQRLAWQSLLKGLATAMKTGDLEVIGKANRSDPIRRILTRPGLKLDWHDGGQRLICCGAANLPGRNRAKVVLFGFDLSEDVSELGCLALLKHDGMGIRASLVEASKDLYSLICPKNARRLGNKLYISGQTLWVGNSPRSAVWVYAPHGGKLDRSAAIVAQEESWDPPPLFPATNGRGIKAVYVQGRGYPKNLPACHATANFAYLEKWSFTSGKPNLEWRREENTPYNALDRLYGALCDRKNVRHYCVSDAVAKKVMSLREQEDQYEDTWYPDHTTHRHAETIGIINLRAKFHFTKSKRQWLVDRVTKLDASDDERIEPEAPKIPELCGRPN